MAVIIFADVTVVNILFSTIFIAWFNLNGIYKEERLPNINKIKNHDLTLGKHFEHVPNFYWCGVILLFICKGSTYNK